MTRHRQNREPYENRLTAEGWVYLVVLIFITVGSVIRNVNLLILMSGMMFAPLFLNWRMGVRRLKFLGGFRRVPRQIHANELAQIQWTCENRMSSMAAWNLVIDDQIEKVVTERDGPPDGEPQAATGRGSEQASEGNSESKSPLKKEGHGRPISNVRVGYVTVGSGQSAVQSYRVFFGQRGEYRVGPGSLTTTFPFGLIRSRRRFFDQETIYVGPAVGRLTPDWERRVQSIAVGSVSLKRQRSLEEDEFYALRPWRSGDAKRNIHWRTTAKYGLPIIKQHDQQNNRDFAMVLDLCSVPRDVQAAQRCELVLSFATTALLQIGSAVQGQVAVGIAGDSESLCHSRTHGGVVSDAMQQFATAKFTSEPELDDLLFRVSAQVSNGTPLYVVSSRDCPQRYLTDHLMEVEQTSANRERVRVARKLRFLLPSVRWLHVDSDEFKRIFESTSESVDANRLSALSKKWGGHVRS